MGLPGAGKTTLAVSLALRLNAVHFNADEVRQNINKDLDFPNKTGSSKQPHGLALVIKSSKLEDFLLQILSAQRNRREPFSIIGKELLSFG